MAGNHIMQIIQSPYPALNVMPRNEPVAIDMIQQLAREVRRWHRFLWEGFLMLLMSWGCITRPNSKDVIQKRGAMDKLISNSARVEISN